LGDARLQLENEARAGKNQQFDVLFMDAFTGDSVPTHLLTREACEVYLQHLKSDGILVFNITNTHLDLHPVINKLAEHFGLSQRRIYRVSNYEKLLNRNYFMLLSKDATVLEPIQDEIGDLPDYLRRPRQVRMWTDDYTNLTSLLR
jgi:spermidine synthase